MSAESSSNPPPPLPPMRRRLPSQRESDDLDWDRWGKHVLSTLERLDQESEANVKRLQKLEISMAILTTRVGLYAAGVSAIIAGIIEIAVALLHK